ncbi:hypothetical protein GCM10022267_08020 [Lentzea roselyniae]|uniref:Uncharacterized protein n=1 Tax=Lentzea roselyniae TaxID=531940 RepID=A0ABP7A3P1_9PSEU
MLTENGVNLFSKPADVGAAPSLAHGERPRGLTEAGWVRTTGWLQVGDHPVHSASVAALAGLLWSLVGAAVLVNTAPVLAGVLVLATPLLCGGLWWLYTAYVRPSSSARNIERKHAHELEPGDLVRLCGSIGPIGQVIEVASGEDVRVVFHGGGRQTWPCHQVVHIAELLS